MTHTLSLIDQLRIERVVWDLDQRIYDLPYRTRITTRREVRANLRTAAREVGAKNAIRNLGSIHTLAAGYLDAQFGGRPRASWLSAALFLATTTFVLQSLLTDAALGFRDGVLSANPSFTGTKTWDGIWLLQTKVTYTFVDSGVSFVGGAFSPVLWALLAIGAIVIGRLWRVIPKLH